VFAPCKPGLFALAEEVLAPGEMGIGEGKRMLALFQISEAHDLGMALGRLFLSGSPDRERLASGQCFARYVVIEDGNQRRTALSALQRWMASSAEAISGMANGGAEMASRAEAVTPTESSNKQAQIGPPMPVPSGF